MLEVLSRAELHDVAGARELTIGSLPRPRAWARCAHDRVVLHGDVAWPRRGAHREPALRDACVYFEEHHSEILA